MRNKTLGGAFALFIISFLTGTCLAFLAFYGKNDPLRVPGTIPAPPTASASSELPKAPDTPISLKDKYEFLREQAQMRESYRTERAETIGSFTTDLGSHNDSNRVHNIKLSLASINKTVLLPGETFSFHGTIGDSTNGKLGYKPATVIIGKEFATDYGGGICQVSSTLYNAVARAKLRVVERYSHSLPVDYVPKGQDATVSYPDLDFKFMNNSDSPVRIEASLQGSKVTCQILRIP
jgi:vancomycin resistance protein YoaR